jgi:hypothetical protein
MDAAEDLSVSFHTVPNDSAVAMRANRRQRVDGALETVEGVTLPADDHFKRLVVFVLGNFACSHIQMFSRAGRSVAVFASFAKAKLHPATFAIAAVARPML